MALRADAVAPCRIQLHRVDDFARTFAVTRNHFGDVVFSRPMAPLATDASLPKGRVAEAVLRAGDRLKAAGMAFQASGTHRPGEMDEPMLLVSGRDVPLAGQRIVGDGSLKEESIQRREVASAHSAGSHEPSQQPLAAHSRLSSRELQAIAFGRHRNTIIRAQGRVRKIRAVKVLAEGARSHFPAAQRHAGSGILDGRFARGSRCMLCCPRCPAPSPPPTGTAEGASAGEGFG